VFALAEVSALGFAVFRLIQGEHVVIAAWSAAFLSLGTGYVLAFLVGMERYERRPVTPWYAKPVTG
jgi:hypothetical protein